MLLTILIIVGTVIVSIAAFNMRELMYKYNFNAYQIVHRKQWYRIFTHAFLHANWEHLIFNMISFYFFAPYVVDNLGGFWFLIIYVGAIVVSSIQDLVKYRNNYNYNSLGASGAVSAIIFTSILLQPQSKIAFIFLPIPIPAFIFGALYLAYSYYMSKKNIDNIGHGAHFWGAVFGFVFPILIEPGLLSHFFNQILP